VIKAPIYERFFVADFKPTLKTLCLSNPNLTTSLQHSNRKWGEYLRMTLKTTWGCCKKYSNITSYPDAKLSRTIILFSNVAGVLFDSL